MVKMWNHPSRELIERLGGFEELDAYKTDRVHEMFDTLNPTLEELKEDPSQVINTILKAILEITCSVCNHLKQSHNPQNSMCGVHPCACIEFYSLYEHIDLLKAGLMPMDHQDFYDDYRRRAEKVVEVYGNAPTP